MVEITNNTIISPLIDSQGGYTWPHGNISAPPAAYQQGSYGGVGGAASCWIPSANGQVPPGALQGGQDQNGEPIYVARARHDSTLVPGKLVPSHNVAYVAYGGAEHPHSQYEVLVANNPTWVPCNGSNIPPQATPAGETREGEPLFVGRVQHEGAVTVGKVQVSISTRILCIKFLTKFKFRFSFFSSQQSHGTCYIPFGGQELAFQNYEILLSNC